MSKKSIRSAKADSIFSDFKTSTNNSDLESEISIPLAFFTLTLEGEPEEHVSWTLVVLFKSFVLSETKWIAGDVINTDFIPMDLRDEISHATIANTPLNLLLRQHGGKANKEQDPMMSSDNKAGASVDLYPLLTYQAFVFENVHLVDLETGEKMGFSVEVSCKIEPIKTNKIALTITMLSVHCLPKAKDNTVYTCAIGLDDLVDPISVSFGTSLSTESATNVVWASCSTGGYAANTSYHVPNEDFLVPYDFEIKGSDLCESAYWNAMRRVLVDPEQLKERLNSPFYVELAGVAKGGKSEVRGRYMAFVDGGVLLEAGETGVSVSSKLTLFNEADLPENMTALLELPVTSAKASAREVDPIILDEEGHNTYIILRFDVMEPLVPKIMMAMLFETLGFLGSEEKMPAMDELHLEPPPEDTHIDARRISHEGGALSVHKELCSLACRGAVPMSQGIKRTAANRLLIRVRTMLKQFSPSNCPLIDFHDIVTGQHSSCRRAVLASFAPQPPPLREPPIVAASRCRLAGDTKLANKYTNLNLKVAAGHPRSLLTKALRCLEQRNDMDAKNYLMEALNAQPKNRFILWTYAAQEFDKEPESRELANSAFRLGVKGDHSNGIAKAIGRAALHTMHHFNDRVNPAFVYAKKMRKAFELPKEWNLFLKRWSDISGEEEVFWNPRLVTPHDPMLIAAAFFLCLRCYKFSEQILQCLERGCSVRGSRLKLKSKVSAEVYYIRAASLVLRRQVDRAVEVIQDGILKKGPTPMLCQMRATCFLCARGWDADCKHAFEESEKAGVEASPLLLLQAAFNGLKSNPEQALQYAARAHKIAPGAHSAFIIGRIYSKLGEMELAERWTAVAVKIEPYLADGWAFLALLALYARDMEKARAMIRTARQVGTIHPDMDEKVRRLMELMQFSGLSDALLKNLCFCEYY